MSAGEIRHCAQIVAVKFDTLGKLLLDNYVTQFMADMQNLKGGYMPGYNTVAEDTNFGVLLHKEELWSLYQYKEEKSLLYHLCRNLYGRFELNNNPCSPEDGKCIACDNQAPEEIHGLWKLHNFEWIQQNGGVHV
jgi:hypothetical protein